MINCIKGDITKIKRIDAIVNAANESLLGGGGVDGAIHKAAGPKLLEECKKLNGCKTGFAKITGAYNIDTRYIIHTVGPIWRGGKCNEDNLLASCYNSCLDLAYEYNIKKIAFPSISTGIYSFPLERAAEIAIKTLKNHPHYNDFTEICFVAFDDLTYETYTKYINKLIYEKNGSL